MWLSAHRQPKNPCHQCWIIDPVLIWGINDFSRIIGTSPLVQRREWACCSAQSCTHWRLWIQAPAFTLAWILFDMDTDRNQIRHLKTFLRGDQCFSVKRAIKSGLSALLLSPSWLLLTTSSLLHTSVDENKVALIQSYTKKKKKKNSLPLALTLHTLHLILLCPRHLLPMDCLIQHSSERGQSWSLVKELMSCRRGCAAVPTRVAVSNHTAGTPAISSTIRCKKVLEDY